VISEAPETLKFDFESAKTRLYKSEVAMSYLINKRKLTKESILEFGLGLSENGRSILIPNYYGGEVYSARFRSIHPWTDKDGNEWRYWSVRGSRPIHPYGIPHLSGDSVIFIAEGEFKCQSVLQMGFDCIGTHGTVFLPRWYDFIRHYKRIVYLRDTRDLGGMNSAVSVKRIIPSVEIVRVPEGKAIDDYYCISKLKAYKFLKEIRGA